MTNDEIAGKNFYLRITEPIKFIQTLIKNVEKSKEKGFKIKIFFGGPEEFPSHEFDENDIKSKKHLLFLYGISYWTHMAIDIKGKTAEENVKEINNILFSIEDEVTTF